MVIECSKERELGEMHTNLLNITKKIDDIHHVLMGNGKPGLVNEFNQWKGAIKVFNWLVGICLTILTIAVAYGTR